MNRRLHKNPRPKLIIDQLPGGPGCICPYLNPIGSARRAQKQKILKQLVIVSTGFDTSPLKIFFKQLAIGNIFKNRDVHPRLRSHNFIFISYFRRKGLSA